MSWPTSCRHALLSLALVFALAGCDEEARPLAPPPPSPPPARRRDPVVTPAPTPLRERADVPWAPTRYAPALGLLARDGLKVDVDPATGRETLYEVDLELGELALRRARTADHDGVGLVGRGWRSGRRRSQSSSIGSRSWSSASRTDSSPDPVHASPRSVRAR